MKLLRFSISLLLILTTSVPGLQAATEPPRQLDLQAMIDQARTAPLDRMIESCAVLLYQETPFALSLHDFYHGRAKKKQAEKLTILLNRAATQLHQADDAINDLLEQLETQPLDTWQSRFGDTGFYQALKQAQTNTILLHAAANTTRASIQMSPESVEMLMGSLRDVSLKIAGAPDGSPQWRLWQIRIERQLVRSDPKFLTQANDHLRQLRRDDLPLDLQWQLGLEDLRAKRNTDSIKKQTNALHAWLLQNQDNLPNLPSRQLRLVLFSHSLQNPKSSPNQTLTNQLDPLKALADKQPSLMSLIRNIAATQLDEYFNPGPSQKPLDRKWDDFELLALAQYYRSQTPAPHSLLIRLCDRFLNTRPSDHPQTPMMLYDRARCRYQIYIMSDANSGTNLEHAVGSVKDFNRLATQYPHWSTTQFSALTAARHGASLAYNLYTLDPDRFGPLALEAIPTLTGTFAAGESQPTGPFAQSAPAKAFRYYHALTLQADKQYDHAARMFNAVPQSDPKKFPARFFTVRCSTLHAKTNPPPAADLPKLYRNWIDNLDQLRQQTHNSYDEIKPQITILLTRLVLESPQPNLQKAFDLLETLPVGPDHSALFSLALNRLIEQRNSLFDLHARGETEPLLGNLNQSLPLAKMLYEKRTQQPADRNTPAARIYLEIATLKAITDDPNHPSLDLILPTQQLITNLLRDRQNKNKIWLTRCRALLTYAQSDFDQSAQLWYAIRRATEPAGLITQPEPKTNLPSDPLTTDRNWYWWEARYFSLLCFLKQQTPDPKAAADRVSHLIDMLKKSHPTENNPWLTRIEKLQHQLQ